MLQSQDRMNVPELWSVRVSAGEEGNTHVPFNLLLIYMPLGLEAAVSEM